MSKRITIVDSSTNQLEFKLQIEQPISSGKRVYMHYSFMEEYSQGMWRSVSGSERESLILCASKLMKSSENFTSAMRLALDRWPNSCAVNLSDRNQNRIAWMGHAGCCVAISSPEDATRESWWTLNSDEQRKANEAAQNVINEWEHRCLKTI